MMGQRFGISSGGIGKGHGIAGSQREGIRACSACRNFQHKAFLFPGKGLGDDALQRSGCFFQDLRLMGIFPHHIR